MSGRDGQFGSAGRNPFEQSAPPTQAFPPVYNNGPKPQAQPMGQQPGPTPFPPGMLPPADKPRSKLLPIAVGSPRGGATGYLVDAYSSVTGRSYSMNCTEKTNGETRCTGGNNAVVVLIER